MAVIHNKKKFRKAAELIRQGKNYYAFYRLKHESYSYPIYFLLVLIGIYFWSDDYLFDLIKYSFIFFISAILSYFSNRDSFLELMYDFNDTIDYYNSNDPSFFDGIEYKKYNIRFTEDSVIITQ